MERHTIITIIVVIIIIAIIYWLFFSGNKTNSVNEPFIIMSQRSDMNDNYTHGDNQAPLNNANMKIDTLVCHPSCCGNDGPAPFLDGLTPSQIQQSFIDSQNAGPYVRTNYTCANGPNGVGCPCVPKNTYLSLANRGQAVGASNQIEPTLMVGGDNINNQNNNDITTQSPQVYTNNRKMNDSQIDSVNYNISSVIPYGAPITNC